MKEGYYGIDVTQENWKARTYPWTSPEEIIEYRRQYPVRTTMPETFVELRQQDELDEFSDIMDQLPVVDLPFAIDLFSKMAADEDPKIRAAVAYHAASLYFADRELGMMLFVKSFNDDAVEVGSQALSSIHNALDEGLISEEDAAPILREDELGEYRYRVRAGRTTFEVIRSDPQPS